jgi:hypothetical protein
MIELPHAPTDVTRESLTFTNSSPIDVFENRSGVATLVIGHPTGAAVFAEFSDSSDPIDASNSIPIEPYTILEISKATRYMTLFGNGTTTVWWYVT